jgi:dephospho-CoA kinase
MRKIGITGSMGSGKTFISMKFASLDVPVLIIDQVTKQLQNTNKELISKIKKRFPGSYDGDIMNKNFMIQKLFFDDTGENLKDISEIIKPFLKDELDKFYKQNQNKKYVLVESALIYEYDFQDQFDEIIFVNSDVQLRKKMAMKRDQISSDEYDRRMKKQLTDEFKIQNSKWVIQNNYTDDVFEQVKQINEKI